MVDAEGLIVEIARRLGRESVTALDLESGRLELRRREGDGTVVVDLPPAALCEFVEQLDAEYIPDLLDEPPERWNDVRVKYIAIWIDELVGSDLAVSLQRVTLSRDRDGTLFVDDQRGPARAPRQSWPDLEEGAYWSAERSDG